MTMTVTVPAQTDELRVVTTPPTTIDAQLILQLMQVSAATGADEGWQLLNTFETPPTRSQLERKYPRDSEAYRRITAFLAHNETMATFVRQGILSETLVNDVFWVKGGLAKAEKICKAARKETGEPRIMENFEWLASRAT